MKTLIYELNQLKKKFPQEERELFSDALLDHIYTVYPFNKFEYVISHLIAKNIITLDQYLNIRSAYLKRNKYLYLFELAPRTFGETWGQRHLIEIVPEFEVPNKQLDPSFKGEYDLWLDGIRVEVKASRAVRKKGGSTLSEKALSRNDNAIFDMNYQQLKPSCCDVFVWIAVWRDKIDYWLMSSIDVQNYEHFSNQHRASQLSDSGDVVEGQIHINDRNYDDFEPYRVNIRELYQKIIDIGKHK